MTKKNDLKLVRHQKVVKLLLKMFLTVVGRSNLNFLHLVSTLHPLQRLSSIGLTLQKSVLVLTKYILHYYKEIEIGIHVHTLVYLIKPKLVIVASTWKFVYMSAKLKHNQQRIGEPKTPNIAFAIFVAVRIVIVNIII